MAVPPGQAAPSALSQERDFGLRSTPPASLPPFEGKHRSSIPRFKQMEAEHTDTSQTETFWRFPKKYDPNPKEAAGKYKGIPQTHPFHKQMML